MTRTRYSKHATFDKNRWINSKNKAKYKNLLLTVKIHERPKIRESTLLYIGATRSTYIRMLTKVNWQCYKALDPTFFA